MLRFQFYTSNEVITRVRLDTALAEEQTNQLVELGFTKSGEVIAAPTILNAMKQHEENYTGSIKNYATFGVVAGIYAV